MKLNWGSYIVIAFALFMAFILYFVVKVQVNRDYDNELVIDEYYKHDAHFGDEMTKLQNAESLQTKPVIGTEAEGVKITFPNEIDPKLVSGTLSFYRPSSKKLDFSHPLKLIGNSMIIAQKDLAGGRWDVTLYWKYNNREYLLKKQLYLN